MIANLCSDSGFPQMLLQVVDFADLYMRRYGMVRDGGPEAEKAPVLN
jgi:preprotein translocase subunit SecB